MITQEQLKKSLYYDPETGVFTWNFNPGNKIKLGDSAGGATSGGYLRIRLSGTFYPSHRLAWLYMRGGFPVNHIDHVDGDRKNNRISNLRDVTNQENHKNQKMPKTNISGHIGIYWSKTKAKWHAQIAIDGKTTHLGYFTDIEDAATARKASEAEHGFHENHGRTS
jgi:hypothetical protein